jgi:hypothetical protein
LNRERGLGSGIRDQGAVLPTVITSLTPDA